MGPIQLVVFDLAGTTIDDHGGVVLNCLVETVQYGSLFGMTGSIDSIQPGIDFFAQLKKKGNFTPARANEANLVKGEVGIGIIWVGVSR